MKELVPVEIPTNLVCMVQIQAVNSEDENEIHMEKQGSAKIIRLHSDAATETMRALRTDASTETIRLPGPAHFKKIAEDKVSLVCWKNSAVSNDLPVQPCT